MLIHVKMPTIVDNLPIVGILTCISMINATSDNSKERSFSAFVLLAVEISFPVEHEKLKNLKVCLRYHPSLFSHN